MSQNNIIFDILEREETKKKESKHFLLSENLFQALLHALHGCFDHVELSLVYNFFLLPGGNE